MYVFLCTFKHLQADERLKGTLASEKNEILFSEFNVNYNKEPEQFKKGTSLVRKVLKDKEGGKPLLVAVALYSDIISDKFWMDNPEILECKQAGEFSNVSNSPVFSITTMKDNR